MSKYLVKSTNTSLSKIIFSVRAGIFYVKIWNEWNYRDTLFVMCKLSEETMDHFMNCTAYGNETCDIRWKDIFENDTDVQNKIAIEIKRRQVLRKLEIDKVACLFIIWLQCSSPLLSKSNS